MQSSVSRRRVLAAAGLSGAALVATACGASGDSGSGAPASAAAAEDLSDSEKVVNWSN